jgi:hypothetical protein
MRLNAMKTHNPAKIKLSTISMALLPQNDGPERLEVPDNRQRADSVKEITGSIDCNVRHAASMLDSVSLPRDSGADHHHDDTPTIGENHTTGTNMRDTLNERKVQDMLDLLTRHNQHVFELEHEDSP